MPKTYRLTSSDAIHTPGMVTWGINGYAFKRDRKRIKAVFTAGYGLSEVAAHELLLGKSHTIEGEVVILTTTEDDDEAE
jgi:hypothetical protein